MAIESDDESAAHASHDAETQSDSSAFPHLKQHTPDAQKVAWSNFVLQRNAGAYSEREREMYEVVGTDEMTIKNLERRNVKKGPDAGTEGR
jgi:hypothetical protein